MDQTIASGDDPAAAQADIAQVIQPSALAASAQNNALPITDFTSQPPPASTPTSLTGNPVIDTAIRSLIMILGSTISTTLISYMAKYGITNDTVTSQVSILVGTILSTIAAVAAAVWSMNAKHSSVTALVDNAIVAALTGQVPDAVKAMANSSQKIAIHMAGK